MKNIKVNAIANLLMRVLNIVFPLITGPYIARILNKTEYGYFNITNTFIGLFIPFATLGIYNYGIRAISKAKENKQEINRIFSLLFYHHFPNGRCSRIKNIVLHYGDTSICTVFKY